VGNVPPGVYAPSSTPRGITLLGRVSDAALRALYENAGCFVFPSRYEGFGLPPLEGMSLGCPVAASDLPPLRESCGGAALFFDPDDPGDILASIRRLVEDPRRRRDRIRAGRERARELTWDRAAVRWLELLDSPRLFGERSPA
jgi:glycosyltransferase involved in cell wall biosynthesis